MTNRDPFALRPPDATPEACTSAVTALMRVALACDEAVRLLDGTVARTAGWTGEASLAFAEQRAAVAARVAELADCSGSAAGAVQRWWPQASLDKTAMLQAVARADLARRQEDAALAAGLPYRPELTAEHDAAATQFARAHDAWTSGAHRMRQDLHGAQSRLRDRPMTFGDHAEEFATALWTRGITEPASAAWALTGQAFVDRDGWWRDVSAVPGRARDAVDALFTDPLGTLGGAVDAQSWADGHIGAGAGAVAALAVPGPKGVRAFRLQSLDELFRGVDLARHEHPDLGHTLARHVEVDDTYLVDRLRHGTLLPDGTRGFIPRDASRFFDRATAEAAITQTLRLNERAVRSFAESTDFQRSFKCTMLDPVGTTIRLGGGVPVQTAANGVVVVLRRNEGGIFVFSAYAEVARG